MALSMSEQYETAMNSVSSGDIDTLAKVFTHPDSVTPDEMRTVAQKMGIKKGFLSAAVDTFSDPLVLMSFLMSAKFPVRSLAKGVIEQRFWGQAKDWAGLSRVGAHINGVFTDTLIPRLNGIATMRRQKIHGLADIYSKITDIPTWADDSRIVYRLLDGEVPAGALQRHHALKQRIRDEVLDPLWGMLQGTHHIVGGEKLANGQRTMPQSLPMEEAFARGIRGNPAPKYIRDWIAHVPLRVNAGTGEFILDPRAVIEAHDSNKIIGELAALKGIKHPYSEIKGGIQSDKVAFDRWAGQNTIFSSALQPRKKHGYGSEGGYEMNLDYIMHTTFSSAARTYSMNKPLTAKEIPMATVVVRGDDGIKRTIRATDEPIIVQMMNEGLRATVGKDGKLSYDFHELANTGYTDRLTGKIHKPILIRKIRPGQQNEAGLSALEWLIKGMKGQVDDKGLHVGTVFNKVYEALYKMTPKIGIKKVNELAAEVQNQQRKGNPRENVAFVTSYMYRSILGMNPWSAMQNALQTPLTIYPSLGFGDTMVGMLETAKRTKGFVNGLSASYRTLPPHIRGTERLKRAMVDSMQKNWPEIADLGGSRAMFELDPELMQRLGKLDKYGKFRGLDTFLDAIMLPFMGAEFANRSNAYFGKRAQIKRAMKTGEYPMPEIGGKKLKGFELEKIVDFEAKQFIDETQFIPSPGSKSVLQYNLDPFERMFTSFPLRIFNYYSNSLTKGALSNAEMQSYRSIKGFYENMQREGILAVPGLMSSLMGGRNLGVLARGYIGSQLLVNSFRDVAGVDLAGSLGLLSSFGGAPDHQPFAPFPLPPVMGVTLGVVSAFSNRDIKKMQPMILPGGQAIPIPKALLPGGIGVSRMFKAMNQFRPDVGGFVDDNDRLMYRGGETDLILRMLGVPLEKARHERQMMERMKANRGRIRQHRRDFVNATANGDIDKMDVIRGRWKQEFPDMPPINTTKGTLKLYEANRQRTRVERMMRTLPKGFQYIKRDLYDVEPDLWSTPPSQAF